jgi:hypothetical protein
LSEIRQLICAYYSVLFWTIDWNSRSNKMYGNLPTYCCDSLLYLYKLPNRFCENAGSIFILGFDNNTRNLRIGKYISDVYDNL